MHPGEQGRPVGGQEVAEGAEADGQVELGGEGRSPRVRAYPFPVRVGTARLGEHAGAEVQSRDPAPAQRVQDPQAGPRAAAHVQPVTEGTERAQGGGGRVEDPVRRTERRVVEPRREQVVSALDGGEGLHGQLAQRGPFG